MEFLHKFNIWKLFKQKNNCLVRRSGQVGVGQVRSGRVSDVTQELYFSHEASHGNKNT